MKKLLMCAVVAAAIGSYADDAFTLVNDPDGFSYIRINENLDSFSFDVLKYENYSLNGHAGYFVYTDGMSGRELSNYIKENGVGIAKNQKLVDVGPLSEGDKLAFYRWEKSGSFLGWGGRTVYDTDYILGTKVVSRSTDRWGNVSETVLDEGTFVDFISGNTYQTGDGGWMKIEISAVASSSSSPVNAPSGAPLPGALAMLFVGGIGAGALKLGKRK